MHPAHAAMRPEHVTIVSSGAEHTHPSGISGTVVAVEGLGHEQLVQCDVSGADERVVVRIDAEHEPPSVGAEVRLALRPDRLHLFDPTSGRRLDDAR